MKLQFGTATLLLTVAFVAIALAGGIAERRYFSSISRDLAPLLVFTSPCWVPLVFAAYALGRKKLTIISVLAFGLAEVAAFGSIVWMVKLM